MQRALYYSLVLLAAGFAVGCVGPVARCPGPSAAMISDELYLGMSMPGGVVAPSEWTDFLNEVVTPRFPQGFSSWQAAGQWQSANGEIIRETSHVLAIVHMPDAASNRAVAEVAADYKSRFRQDAVLRVRNLACVTF